MLLDKIRDLQNICRVVSNLKSQLIEELPHYGHDTLFLKNNEITTGLLNNVTEIKLNLVTGGLLYLHSEQGHFIDLIRDKINEQLEAIVTRYGLNIPQTPRLTNLSTEDLSDYLAFARKANRQLRTIQNEINWNTSLRCIYGPDGFDFSVEWFTREK